MDNIFVFLTIFLILPTIEAKCSDKNDVHSFGDNCRFMCHCEQNTECNETTGECSNGCARGWYGPGCQYRDIIENKYSKLSDNSYSILATDGETNTCSRDVKSNRTEQLFWTVELSNNETIHEIQISTKAKSLVYFKNFTVFVGYSPSSRNYDTVDERVCFRQGHDIPNTSTFIVLCRKPVIGNVVKIELAQSQNVLELCDVRINGGRNLAFKRDSSQSSTFKVCGSHFCKSSNAVDGYTSIKDMYECSLTNEEENPWWQMYTDYKIRILNIEIKDTNNHKQIPYVVHITNTNDTKIRKEGSYRTKVVRSDTPTQSITMYTMGKFVTISVEGKHRLTVCEVFVFGDCRKRQCGYNCEEECQCNHATIWDRISGNCAISCDKKEIGYQCNMPCKNNDDCTFKCGENCFGGDCNPESGECTKGCKPGWEGTFCKNTCDRGYFGHNCLKKCSYHCKYGNEYCNKVDGNCTHGCMDGWKAQLCDKACDAGFYGRNCTEKCSEHCAGGNRNCNTTTGYCKLGCQPGWTGLRCVNACPPRKFGKGCNEACASTCKNDVCNHINGTCLDGCKPGYQENKCERACDPGFYGHNCLKKCSDHCKHRNEYCNNVDGNCTYGCMDGWKAPLCDQACDAGFYGRNCTEKCSKHCAGGNRNCNTTTGYCEMGCQSGWTGLRCVNACPSRKFGAGCKESCASTCKNDACDHVNGICRDGCKRGYQGDKCESECGPGTFGENCQEKCSTTCKNGVCSHLDGGCSNGCKPGYHGNKCEQKCRDGTFGEECKEDCSSNCNNNTCDHVTGNCTNGYKPGYKGNTCGENNILSGAKPDTGSNEARKPNIVLICVGILCVIVVVYATVITILFKRKTTHYVKVGTNVSCSGRSNDDAITSKTNKTETVTAEAAKEAATELARVNINVIHDESHQYTDLTPDTEDVEAAYETIQLE